MTKKKDSSETEPVEDESYIARRARTDAENKKENEPAGGGPSPGTEELQNRLNVIRKMQSVVDQASREVADIKEQLKNAKEKREAAIIDLCIFIRNGEMPLFDTCGDQQSAVSGQQPAEPWRTIFLSDLSEPGIKPSVLAKLAHAKIETVGDLVDKTASGHLDLTDIPGIGLTAAVNIESALEAFWRRRKETEM